MRRIRNLSFLGLFLLWITVGAGTTTSMASADPDDCSEEPLCEANGCCLAPQHSTGYCETMCEWCELGWGHVEEDESCQDNRWCECEGIPGGGKS